MKRNIILITLSFLILALGAGAYFFLNKNIKNDKPVEITQSSTVESSAVEPSSATPSTVVPTGTAAPTGNNSVKEFTVDGSNFAFNPTEIKVKKGDTVKITFRDDDGMHNLVVDGYNVGTKVIRGGTEDSITFLADKAGSFEYYCSVANHRESGMVGTLIVE